MVRRGVEAAAILDVQRGPRKMTGLGQTLPLDHPRRSSASPPTADISGRLRLGWKVPETDVAFADRLPKPDEGLYKAIESETITTWHVEPANGVACRWPYRTPVRIYSS
jgi:hypothetical protein